MNVSHTIKAIPNQEIPSPSIAETPNPVTPTIEIETPTAPQSSTAISAPTSLPTASPMESPTATATLAPTATADELCTRIAAQDQRGLYVLYVHPSENLRWDQAPRSFSVGLCNSLPVPLVPESHFVVSILIPWHRDGAGQTSSTTAQLSPGFHELVLGSWTPGLENHVTICVQKAVVEVVVGYSDETKSSNFRPLPYPDGKDKALFPVQCGGNYA